MTAAAAFCRVLDPSPSVAERRRRPGPRQNLRWIADAPSYLFTRHEDYMGFISLRFWHRAAQKLTLP
jgi:hypothetical protein